MSRDEIEGREHYLRRQLVISDVLKTFGAIWPRAFAPDARDGLLNPWLDVLQGIDTDALEPAAKELLRDGQLKYPPKPWEFAKVARAIERKLQGASSAPPRDTEGVSVFAGARAFRYAKPGPKSGYGRLDEHNAIAFALTRGGTLNISEHEMDRLLAHEIEWSWILPADVPREAAPQPFFTWWKVAA